MWADRISAFVRDESGTTAIEWALLGTLIAVAIVGTFAAVGNSVFGVMGAGAGGASDAINAQLNQMP